MDAKSVLTEYNVPKEMPISYTSPYGLDHSGEFACTNASNELWKLVSVLHILDRINLSGREIEFHTHCQELSEVSEEVESLYGFLTERSVRIRVRIVAPPPTQQKLFEPRSRRPLVLYSGGLDSVAAALSMNQQMPSLLFHATTSNIILSRAKELRNSCLGLACSPIACGDCRFSSLGGGFSQTRGLLFLSAAINAASNLGINQVIMGENGPLMINPSVSPSSISSKNAHPRLLIDLQRIIHELGYGKLSLVALHKDLTKAEIVFRIPEAWKDSIAKSYSCSRTQGLTAMCGLCFACFVRKLSLLAASVHEPDSLYEADPLTVGYQEHFFDKNLMDLKDSLSYYKRFATESDVPIDWNTHIPPSFFENAEEMLHRFALDLFLGARNYFRERKIIWSNALSKYCLDAIDEIGASKLDARESELKTQNGGKWRMGEA